RTGRRGPVVRRSRPGTSSGTRGTAARGAPSRRGRWSRSPRSRRAVPRRSPPRPAAEVGNRAHRGRLRRYGQVHGEEGEVRKGRQEVVHEGVFFLPGADRAYEELDRAHRGVVATQRIVRTPNAPEQVRS